METIEERANLAAWQIFEEIGLSQHSVERVTEIIEEKICEQKTIDIERSCKWLKKELRKLAMDELKDNFLENEFKFVLKSQIPEWLINFRKAMEKQE